ncbi:MAG: xylulokinase [Planctomycetota bacterium]|jgi:xylulokinase|nr:xylulokinase [Planctomycetota bacterium]
MANLLGIDIGTSAVKAIIGNDRGAILSQAEVAYPLFIPRPGWSEQNPEDWWRASVKAVRRALAGAGGKAPILGIGLSGQMHGSVFLDRGGRVIRNAILWNDQRTRAECGEILRRAGGPRRVLRMVANPVFTGFTAPKILWLRNHEPRNFSRVRRILLPKDYLRFRLTGEFAGEMSDASGTLLLDVARREWSRPMLAKLDLDPELLPPIFESTEVSGRLSASAAKLLGLPPGVPVAGGGGDQAMGAVGNGIVKKGVASATIGTSGVIFSHTDRMETEPRGRVHTFCHAVPGTWHLMSCMLSAGGMLEWFVKTLCREEARRAAESGRNVYDLVAAAAARAPAGAGGLYCLPYLTGERTPHSDPDARACFIGLTPGHDKAWLARSVIEGVTFGMRDSLEVMRSLGAGATTMRLSGGGAKSRFWSRLQADIYGVEVEITNSTAGSAFGALLTGGVGAGVWRSLPEACEAAIRVVRRFSPDRKSQAEYDRLYRPFGKLYESLRDNFREIAELG